MSFNQRLYAAIEQHNSLLCIGLDPDVNRLPKTLHHDADAVYTFCHEIIAATHDVAVAFKPNIAFFEAMGVAGIDILMRLMHLTRHNIWILDAKRGDIGNTASAYATSAFSHFNADAITLNPYMGGDSLDPFLQHADRGAFLLCRTSNPGSRDIQELVLADGRPLYLAIAELAAHQWNTNQNVGLVVGATQPEALKSVRTLCPDLPFLLPGIGAQGGDLVDALTAGLDTQGSGLLINASRSILYASNDQTYAHAARTEAIRMRDAINAVRATR